MNKKKLLVLIGVVVLIGVIIVAVVPNGGLSADEKESLLWARENMWLDYVKQVPEIRTIAWLPEGKLLVYANNAEEADYVREHVVPDVYEGWPVEVTYRVLSEDDMWVLIDDAKALAEEYKHVPEIADTSWYWPEGEIIVRTLNLEDAMYVGVNIVPGVYRGWSVIVLIWEQVVPSLTLSASTYGEIDLNPDRWLEHRPLIGGILVRPYIEYADSDERGGGTGPPHLEIQSTGRITQESSSTETAGLGTLGMVTYNNKILSNAHVIAMHPDTGGFLDIGTPILQPWDEVDRVGQLEKYIPIDLSPGAQNYADAAIASIDSGISFSRGKLFNEVFDEGGNYLGWTTYTVSGWTTVSMNDVVRKSGMITCTTTAKVTDTSKSFPMEFSEGIYINFVDHIEVQLVGDYFAYKGDSGSVVDKDGKFVGLVNAFRIERWWHGGIRNSFGYISKAEHIIAGLGIQLSPSSGGGSGEPPPVWITGQPGDSLG